jgi:hypothetical protein
VQRRRRVAIDIFVDVGAAQSDDQRPIRKARAKIPDAVRAAPGVERDHQVRRRPVVAVGDLNVVTELAQDPRPADRRGRIAGS